MRITIGFPTYDDYSGIELSLQSLAAYHDLADVELIVVDNHPTNGDDGTPSDATRKLASYVRAMGGEYVPLPEPVGTAAPRNEIFARATGDAVIVADGHVMMAASILPAVRRYFADEAHARDILTGPLLGSRRRPGGGLQVTATHYADVWRKGMWGAWAQAWTCAACKNDWHFDVALAAPTDGGLKLDERGRIVLPERVASRSPACEWYRVGLGRERVTACPTCGRQLPTTATLGDHVSTLDSLGFVRRCWRPDDVEPFEIPGSGLGLFAMKREHWPGFPEGLRGFGGGELHLHELVRRQGGRAVCHPRAGWWHRFDRDVVPYPRPLWDTVRNYVLWRRRLDLPLDPVHDMFVARDGAPITDAQWEYLIADPDARDRPPAHPAADRSRLKPSRSHFATLAASGDRAAAHMAAVRTLAAQVERQVVVCGKRPHWIAAALGDATDAALSDTAYPLIAVHDGATPDAALPRSRRIKCDRLDSLTAAPIDCELLVLDTVHSGERLAAELERWGPHCRRWIAVYGTQSYGKRAEDGKGSGMLGAIQAFVSAHPEWRRAFHDPRTSGLTVLSCRPDDPDLDAGPGTELAALLAELGIVPGDCECEDRVLLMNAWGVDGCRQRRNEIADWLRASAQRRDWTTRLFAGLRAIRAGVAWRLDPLDPFPSLVQLAIDRAHADR